MILKKNGGVGGRKTQASERKPAGETKESCKYKAVKGGINTRSPSKVIEKKRERLTTKGSRKSKSAMEVKTVSEEKMENPRTEDRRSRRRGRELRLSRAGKGRSTYDFLLIIAVALKEKTWVRKEQKTLCQGAGKTRVGKSSRVRENSSRSLIYESERVCYRKDPQVRVEMGGLERKSVRGAL